MKLYTIYSMATQEKVAEFLSDSPPRLLDDSVYFEVGRYDRTGLPGLKREFVEQVDYFAGVVRGRYMSFGHGIELTYQQKLEEARAFRAAGYVGVAEDYPFVFKEAVHTQKTTRAVADRIITRVAELRNVGAELEGIRLRAHKQIVAATNEQEATAARNYAIESLNVYKG